VHRLHQRYDARQVERHRGGHAERHRLVLGDRGQDAVSRTSVPRYMTSQPASWSRSATMFPGSPCSSPSTPVTTTRPRHGRTAITDGLSFAIVHCVIADAVCSCATLISPEAHSSPRRRCAATRSSR
jgi:hypothetical protein